MSERTAAAERLLDTLRVRIGVLHCRQVRDLALSLFDQLGSLHQLGARERDLLEAAALLHDIGWSISGAKHHKHAYRLIRENAAALPGFTAAEVELIAQIARYHRKALPATSHPPFARLPPVAQTTVRRLAALLRLADGLDRPHLALVRELRCELAADRLRIHVKADLEAGLHIASAARKRSLFETAFGRAVEFAIA